MSLSIRSVNKRVNGKTKRLWRWAYFGVDGKPKFITGKTKSVVEVLAKKKVDEIGLEKTSSSQIFLSEAWKNTTEVLTKES